VAGLCAKRKSRGGGAALVFMAFWRSELLSHFTCLADRCEDTCCRGWSMQVDDSTLYKYRSRASELLEAVEPASDTPWIMRKDPLSGTCVKLENGLCGIHKKYGEPFLSDACHFYPRVTRLLGEDVVMTATLSCPEIARLAFVENRSAEMRAMPAPDRLPAGMKNVLPENINAQDALSLHHIFLRAAQDEQSSAEQILLRISSVSRSLEMIPVKDWAGAAPVYLRLADGRLVGAEPQEDDPFNLLHALCGLVVASHKPLAPRLKNITDAMQRALHVDLDWQTAQMQLHDDSKSRYAELCKHWSEVSDIFAPYLRRYLYMQLALAFFPFGGMGATLSQRITFIAVRLATIRLAIMCAYGSGAQEAPQDMVVRVVQSLSRFLDHLGDPAFSLQIYAEAGWLREACLRGLLEF
jgi:lysine-N-methylase